MQLLELVRPLEKLNKLVPKESMDFQGTVLDPALREMGMGIIRFPIPLVSLAGRESKWKGGTREPRFDPTTIDIDPSLKTTYALVPFTESFLLLTSHNMMPMILHRANMLLRMIVEFNEKRATARDLQVSFSRYQDQLVSELAGKYALFNRSIFGIRMRSSGRCVITPDPKLGPYEVGVPRQIMRESLIGEGDYVCVTRSPVLWEGSVLILIAKPTDSKAGSLNPFVMDLMGADFDGDTVAVFKVPKIPEVLDEVKSVIGKTIKRYSRWNAEFLMFNKETEVDWENYETDLDERLLLSEGWMYTLTPAEMLSPETSDIIGNMSETGCKQPPEDLAEYAKGISKEKYVQTVNETTSLTIRMKVELGVVGSITDQVIQAIYAVNQDLSMTALKFKELLTQALLDSKHGTDSFPTFRIVDVFKRSNEWAPEHGKQDTEAIEFLVGIGLPAEVVTPIIKQLWGLDMGVHAVIALNMPLYMSTRRTSRTHLLAVKNGQVDCGFLGSLIQLHGVKDETTCNQQATGRAV